MAYASTNCWFVVYSYHYASRPHINVKTWVTMMAISTGLGFESVVRLVLRTNFHNYDYKQV